MINEDDSSAVNFFKNCSLYLVGLLLLRVQAARTISGMARAIDYCF